MLLSVKPFHHIVALEVQQGLADLARRNIMLNHLDGRITIVEKDFRQYKPWHQFDIVFSNPPYIPKDSGYLSRTAKDWLKSSGSAYFILPDNRREEFEAELSQAGLRLKRCRLVYPREGEPPNFFLAECGQTDSEVETMPPLVLYGQDGKYTEEAEAIFSGAIKR